MRRINEDPLLTDLIEAATVDVAYTDLIKALQKKLSKAEVKNLPTDNGAKDYYKLWDRISLMDDKEYSLAILDNHRIIIPKKSRQKIINLIHLSHQGVTKSYRSCNSRYYWPNLKEIVKKKV